MMFELGRNIPYHTTFPQPRLTSTGCNRLFKGTTTLGECWASFAGCKRVFLIEKR
jgi:hypothetical protein